MLVKNSNNLFFDAHFHYADCFKQKSIIESDDVFGCTCAHNKEEWEIQKQGASKFIKAFGIHPLNIVETEIQSDLDFLIHLILNENLQCIGEIGFDFFTDELKSYSSKQDVLFSSVLDVAIFYKKPVVIHCRKANNKLFEYEKKLKKLPSVLFHSFMGPSSEAQSLINKDINAYFSFGKQMMNNNKKVIDCIQNLSINNLLLETDAPFQFIKNQNCTYTSEIKEIYKYSFELRKEKEWDWFCNRIADNFNKMFVNNRLNTN